MASKHEAIFPFSHVSSLCEFYSYNFPFLAPLYLMLGLFVHICPTTYLRLNIVSLVESQ
jgi:hypothetical protein